MGIEEFSIISKRSISTIRKRLNEIPGAYEEDGEIYFIEGTRYPTRKNFVIRTEVDKYHIILNALNRNEYIDHTYINSDEENFKSLIEQLLKSDYIYKLKHNNPYGANAYQVTPAALTLLENSSYKIKRILRETLGTVLTFF